MHWVPQLWEPKWEPKMGIKLTKFILLRQESDRIYPRMRQESCRIYLRMRQEPDRIYPRMRQKLPTNEKGITQESSRDHLKSIQELSKNHARITQESGVIPIWVPCWAHFHFHLGTLMTCPYGTQIHRHVGPIWVPSSCAGWDKRLNFKGTWHNNKINFYKSVTKLNVNE